MRIFPMALSAALAFFCSPIANAAVALNGSLSDGLVSLVYDPANGSLSLDAAGKEITALEILSAGGNFRGTKPEQVNGLFDVYAPNKLFVLKPGAARFGDQNFGAAMSPGISVLQLAADLTVTGAIYPSGDLGPVDLALPEPTAMPLFGLGLLGAIASIHRKKIDSTSA